MVFALTWACVAWVYPPELFTTGSRGRGTSMTSATNWFVVSYWTENFVHCCGAYKTNSHRTFGSLFTFQQR